MQTPALIPEKTLVLPQQVHLRAPGAPPAAGSLTATIPARSARALLAHPTRFERVTFASRAPLGAQISPGLAVADLRPIG
jgi:hypothetical protein